MKLPHLDRLIVATLPEAYIIAIFFNVMHCKPSTFGEVMSSTLAALGLAIPMVPITWAVLLMLFIPVYALMQIHQEASSKSKAQESEKTTTVDATPTEQPTLLKLPKRDQSDTRSKSPQLPAIPKTPEPTKSPQLPAIQKTPEPTKSPQLPVIQKTPEPTKSPKTPQLPAVPQKSTLPRKID